MKFMQKKAVENAKKKLNLNDKINNVLKKMQDERI